jgi:uncharacterized protein YqfA (UPF0365 family)
VAEVVNALIKAVKEGQDVDLNQLKMEVCMTVMSRSFAFTVGVADC